MRASPLSTRRRAARTYSPPRMSSPAGQQGRVHLPGELQRLLGLADRVGALDLAAHLEGLAQPLGAARDDGQLLGSRAPRANPDAQPAGLDLLARNLRLPEREDV